MTMANKQFTPSARAPRNSRRPAAKSEIAARRPSKVVEDSRDQLMNAEALLQCVLCAMDDDIATGSKRPNYESVIRLALEILSASIRVLAEGERNGC
jgi:hypothetical protein